MQTTANPEKPAPAFEQNGTQAPNGSQAPNGTQSTNGSQSAAPARNGAQVQTTATLAPGIEVKYYPQGYHMMLRDLQGDIPTSDIAAWIDEH